jgi:hypothetical protein
MQLNAGIGMTWRRQSGSNMQTEAVEFWMSLKGICFIIYFRPDRIIIAVTRFIISKMIMPCVQPPVIVIHKKKARKLQGCSHTSTHSLLDFVPLLLT